MNPKRLRKRIRKWNQAIKLPRKLKKLLKQQNAGGWATKDIRITFYGWVFSPDEFGGTEDKEVGLDIPKAWRPTGFTVKRLSEREAEWNKWTGRVGRYKYPLVPSLSAAPRFYYGTPRGRMLSLRTRRVVSIQMAQVYEQ